MFKKTKLLAIIASASFAFNANAAEITGTVHDWNGKPVKNAFVMLKENPYKSVLTGIDGSFSINCEVSKQTLEISAAGSDFMVMPLTDKKENLLINLKQQDPVISEFEIGCNQVTFREKWRSANKRHLTKKQETCVKAYKKFLTYKAMIAIRNKILTNRTLRKDEEKYRYLVFADIALKASQAEKLKTDLSAVCKEYCDALRPHNMWVAGGHQDKSKITKAGLLLERAYRGEKLTQDDLRMLREMIIVESFLGGRKALAPSYLWKSYNKKNSVGTEMGDLKLLKLESALNHPKYSDYSDLNASTFLRPEALAHYLTIFNHWKEDSDGTISPKKIEDFPNYQGYSEDDFVTKKDFLGKPTVVFNTSPLEDGTHPPAIMAFIEYLRRAYGDKINVVYIANVSTYHGDMWDDEFLYYGRNPDANPLFGIDSPAMQHETTVESLARITKLMQMKNPSYSCDIYLDDSGKTSCFSIGGYKRYDLMLFDKNGLRVSNRVGVGVPEETGANGQNVSSYHTPFYGYYILEKNLRNILANNGEFNLEKMDYTMPKIPSRAIVSARTFKPNLKGWYGFCLNVTNVDHEKSEITVENGRFLSNHQLKKIKNKFKMTFVVDKDTRIIIKEKSKYFNGKHNPEWNDSYKHGTLKDIVVGDLLRADILFDQQPVFEDDKVRDLTKYFVNNDDNVRKQYKKAFKIFSPVNYKNKKLKAIRIWNNHTGQGDTKVHQQIVFWGKITKLDSEKKTIEVKMNKPDGNKINGYKFWKEAGDKANISEDTTGHKYRTAEKLAASTRYVEGTDADRIRTFTIDAGVRISRNGFPEKAFSDFKIGDKVSVFYLPFYESQYKNTIPIYPEVILSSSEVK